jgi:hypothetical protein
MRPGNRCQVAQAKARDHGTKNPPAKGRGGGRESNASYIPPNRVPQLENCGPKIRMKKYVLTRVFPFVFGLRFHENIHFNVFAVSAR